MRNLITMFDFFFFSKRKNTVSSETNANDGTLTTSNIDIPISENPQIKNFAPPPPLSAPRPPKFGSWFRPCSQLELTFFFLPLFHFIRGSHIVSLEPWFKPSNTLGRRH